MSTKVLTMFKQFYDDEHAWNMYVYGPAGTGKTYSTAEIIEYCNKAGINAVVVAYTNKACDVLRSKLPANTNVMTLDKFLKKRPGIDESATKVNRVMVSYQHGQPKPVQLMILDEFSFISERDGVLIRELQDPEYLGKPIMKMLALGDDHQLTPIEGPPGIVPEGEYQIKLTKQYRNDNPLQQVLSKLISYIDGDLKPAPLDEVPGYFERGLDLVDNYDKDDIILCWTNKAVQRYNSLVAGKNTPEEGDLLFSPTTHSYYRFSEYCHNPAYIDQFYSGDTLELNSKYMTLEHLIQADICEFGYVIDDDGNDKLFAFVFGHENYNLCLKQFKKAAVQANKKIEAQYRGYKASHWARVNPTNQLARERAKAWRDLLSFQDCVICLDFTYAMTVHKSQGSTYPKVLIDTDDLALCADFDFETYLKLMYVAVSRAQHKVLTT